MSAHVIINGKPYTVCIALTGIGDANEHGIGSNLVRLYMYLLVTATRQQSFSVHVAA